MKIPRPVIVKNSSTLSIFHEVPRIIYADNLNYIHHLKQDIDKLFDPKKNRLLRKGKAERWVFLNDKNEPVGRVAAFINPKTAFQKNNPREALVFLNASTIKKQLILFSIRQKHGWNLKGWKLWTAPSILANAISFGDV